MSELINIEQIHKYINNELSAEELEQFEKKLEQDADLLEEVNAIIILKAKYRAEQKKLWQDYEADYAANPEKWDEAFDVPEPILIESTTVSSRPQPLIRYLKYPIAAAASLLLFLIAYFLIPSSSNPQTLAAQYWEYSTDPNQLISNPQKLKGGQGKVTEDEAANHLDNAHDSYKKEEYKSVSNILQLIPPESQHYSEGLILSGVAYFKLKENKKAINQFKKILNNRDISGNDEARKLLSLIYLQTNQLKEAKKVLTQIIEAGDSFEGEAQKLLKQL